MRIPFNVINNLNSSQIKLWETYYENKEGGWDMRIEEGLWRRTQEEINKEFSGWQKSEDKRRRMIHYKHKYGLSNDASGKCSLGIVESYIWTHLCLPKREIQKNYLDIIEALNIGQWVKIKECYRNNQSVATYEKNSLLFKICRYNFHEEDIKYKRFFPHDYCSMDIKICSKNYRTNDKFEHHPWEVLNTGIRKIGHRFNVHPDNKLKNIPGYFPSQIEIGCGPAIEAGIPPLNFLHDAYYVLDKKSKKFIFEERLGIEIARNPALLYKKFSTFFRRSFLAKPTDFYKILKKFCDEGIIVGPVITNNFDGLPSKLEISEQFIRRFDENNILPDINFHPEARSLMVVGSHADRRKVRELARKRGLKIICIDPEGYYDKNKFYKYPLESLDKSDLLFRGGATESFRKLYRIFFGKEFNHEG